MMVITEDGHSLGNHFHDYEEVFFAPNERLLFALVDNDEHRTVVYELRMGSRIVIPLYVSHRVVGKKNAVLRAWGNVPFDRNRLIPSDPDLVALLKKEIDEAQLRLWKP